MKANEFITEDEIDNEIDREEELEELHGLPIEVIEVLNVVKKDCQPYLHENKSPFVRTPMYRGIDDDKFFLKKQVRLTDRRPLSISKESHDKINYYFDRNFGEPFRDALFVTGDENTAKGYGKVYHIFPVGNFKYLWSASIDDLYGYLTGIRLKYDDLTTKHIYDLLDFGNYKTDNLMMGLRQDTEIMVRCKKYYAIKKESIKGLEKNMEKYLHS